ncbi:hypothetical protein [Limnothrix redekei]|uniref:Uncharacterized protein n=1 Tax=Limnothrix redekei LRLZ20PSL1 TaxID=3112953 RepID=A0ABW7CCR8_9CYAN
MGSDSLSNCQIPEALGQWCDRHSSPIPLAQLARRSIPVPARLGNSVPARSPGPFKKCPKRFRIFPGNPEG